MRCVLGLYVCKQTLRVDSICTPYSAGRLPNKQSGLQRVLQWSTGAGDERQNYAAAAIRGGVLHKGTVTAERSCSSQQAGRSSSACACFLGEQQRRTARNRRQQLLRQRQAPPPCANHPAAAGNPAPGRRLAVCCNHQSCSGLRMLNRLSGSSRGACGRPSCVYITT